MLQKKNKINSRAIWYGRGQVGRAGPPDVLSSVGGWCGQLAPSLIYWSPPVRCWRHTARHSAGRFHSLNLHRNWVIDITSTPSNSESGCNDLSPQTRFHATSPADDTSQQLSVSAATLGLTKITIEELTKHLGLNEGDEGIERVASILFMQAPLENIQAKLIC